MKTISRLSAIILGVLTATAALAAPAPITVPTIAALTGGNFSSFGTVQVLGYYAAGDGGGGFFNWAPASVATADVCMTFQTGGLSTGRFVRQLGGYPLTTTQCGVKADTSTNNTAALQAAVTAASTYGIGEVYCPSNTGKVNFATTVNVPTGITLRGSVGSMAVVGQTGAPASCNFNFTGVSVPAFSTQTTVGTVCPSVQGPSFKNFSLDLPNQTSTAGIKLNDPATAGFSDDCSMTPGQSILQAGVIEGIIFHCNQRGTSGISISKAFNYSIRDNTSSFCDYPWQFDGSDNIDFQHNTVSNATIADLKLNGQGTFGNMFYAHNNTFNSVYENAPYFIDSSYGQLILDSNYFETQLSGGTAAINLSGGYNVSIINNGMYILPALMPKWLKVTGTYETLTLSNNWDGGLNSSALFNNGGGYNFQHGSGTLAAIHGSANPGANSGIPFFTNDLISGTGYQSEATPPSAAGALLASVSPTYPTVPNGTYAASLVVLDGCFRVPALAGTGSEFKFTVRPVVVDTVDVWVYAYTPAGSTGQLISISTDNGSSYSTQAVTSTPTWYKIINNTAVSNPVLAIKNSDLAHTSLEARVCNVTYVKH